MQVLFYVTGVFFDIGIKLYVFRDFDKVMNRYLNTFKTDFAFSPAVSMEAQIFVFKTRTR